VVNSAKKIKAVIIPSTASLIEMKMGIKRMKKTDLCSVMYKIGESAGNDFFEYFIKDVKGRKNKIKKIIEILNLTDYGKYELHMSKKFIVIKLIQSPLLKLCSANKGASYHWVCYWMSGLLSGLFKNLNRKWIFEIIKCKNLGYSHCEFKGVIK
jgi:predicted hydrocarbon binding protein